MVRFGDGIGLNYAKMRTDSNSVESIGLQLGNVGCANAVGLDAVDVQNEGLQL